MNTFDPNLPLTVSNWPQSLRLPPKRKDGGDPPAKRSREPVEPLEDQPVTLWDTSDYFGS